MGQFSKKWEDLTIADNFIFCKVMEDEKICKGVLETLLQIRVERIEYLRTENPIDSFYDSRGIRLDVYVKDSGRIFNIEMQTGNYEDILLRARYYLSSSDVATTRRRTKFRDMRETYILFICKEDPFGAGIPKYTKTSGFLETETVPFDDKSHNVFYNCSAWEKEKDAEVRQVLKFIYGLKPESGFALELNKAASLAKQKSRLEDEYMYFSDILEDEKEEAREIGLAEGREEGRAQGIKEGREEGRAEGEIKRALEAARNLLVMNILTHEQIAAAQRLSVEEVDRIAEEIKSETISLQ